MLAARFPPPAHKACSLGHRDRTLQRCQRGDVATCEGKAPRWDGAEARAQAAIYTALTLGWQGPRGHSHTPHACCPHRELLLSPTINPTPGRLENPLPWLLAALAAETRAERQQAGTTCGWAPGRAWHPRVPLPAPGVQPERGGLRGAGTMCWGQRRGRGGARQAARLPCEADLKVWARSPCLPPAPSPGPAGLITSPLRRELCGRDGVGHRHPDVSAAGLEAEAFLIPSFCNQIAVLLLQLIPNLATPPQCPALEAEALLRGWGWTGRQTRPPWSRGTACHKEGPRRRCWRWDAAAVTHQELCSCKGQGVIVGLLPPSPEQREQGRGRSWQLLAHFSALLHHLVGLLPVPRDAE